MNARLLPYVALMLFGIGWGASIPLARLPSVVVTCPLA